jgi:hypothetical protein
MISREEALELWIGLRDDFVSAQKRMEEIVTTKAWEPIGFDSFSDAWRTYMSDVTIAAEIRPFVVYQFLADKQSIEDISAAVKDVGKERAESLAQQREDGIPPEHASMTIVSRHLRHKPSRPDTIHVNVGSDALTEYHHLATAAGRRGNVPALP